MLPNSVAGVGKGGFGGFRILIVQFERLPNDTFAETSRVSLGRRPIAAPGVSAWVSFRVTRSDESICEREPSASYTMPPKRAKEAVALQDYGHVHGWYYIVNASTGIAQVTVNGKRKPY